MYQFERSSTNASKARMTSTVSVASYAAVASATSRRVRSTSQRSSGLRSRSDAVELAQRRLEALDVP